MRRKKKKEKPTFSLSLFRGSFLPGQLPNERKRLRFTRQSQACLKCKTDHKRSITTFVSMDLYWNKSNKLSDREAPVEIGREEDCVLEEKEILTFFKLF